MAKSKEAIDLLDSLIDKFGKESNMELYKIVDCHAHLTADDFNEDLDIVLKEAMTA